MNDEQKTKKQLVEELERERERSLALQEVTKRVAGAHETDEVLDLIINEAARSLDEGVALAEEIDAALRLGTNYPLGPLRWADQIGLDEVLTVLEGLQRATGDDRYRPTPLLKKMVLAGRLGENSGRGFFQYGT